MINIEATGYGGLLLNIGSQQVWLHPTDVVDLTNLAADPDGTTWTQATYTDVEGTTVRTVLAHRHGSTVTVAIGLDGTYETARTTATSLARTIQTVTQAGAR